MHYASLNKNAFAGAQKSHRHVLCAEQSDLAARFAATLRIPPPPPQLAQIETNVSLYYTALYTLGLLIMRRPRPHCLSTNKIKYIDNVYIRTYKVIAYIENI